MPSTFRHIHASGRFDQSPGNFARSLTSLRQRASVITVTEVDANPRAHLLRGDGWDGIWGDRSPRDDCGITWDTDEWDGHWAQTLPVSHRTYINERGHRTGVTAAAYAVLDHHDGKRVLFGSLHTPHGMQDELRADKVRTDVGLAYVSITRAYRNRAVLLADKFNCSALVLSADWNLNVRATWVRAWFAAYRKTTGLRLNWTPPYPRRGTHGTALIDATLYRGLELVRPSVVLPPSPGDDHTAYLNTFR